MNDARLESGDERSEIAILRQIASSPNYDASNGNAERLEPNDKRVVVSIARYEHSSDMDSVKLLCDRHHRDYLLGTTLAAGSHDVENARALAWPVHYYYRNPAIGNNERLVCRIDAEDSASKYLRIDNLVSSAVRIGRWGVVMRAVENDVNQLA